MHIGFSIAADQTGALMKAVTTIAEDAWRKIDDHVWVSEIMYQPIGWKREISFLFLVKIFQ